MSKDDAKKLGTLILTDDEREAIAEMVDSPGFKVWKKKVMPARELQIAGAALASIEKHDLWYHKGMSFENGKQISNLENLAKKHNEDMGDEDQE